MACFGGQFLSYSYQAIKNNLFFLGIYQANFYCETLLTLCRFRNSENENLFQSKFFEDIFEKIIKSGNNQSSHEINLQVCKLAFFSLNVNLEIARVIALFLKK